jgi:hypothetical protein
MKRVLVILAAAILVLTLATGTAFAAKHDKKTKPTTPEVLVTNLSGSITADLGHNEYTFVADDTAAYPDSFILDCGPVWYKVVTLALGPATVTGEVETSKSGALEIGVQSVTANNGTFVIKGEGKPPWAGGKGHKPATAGMPDAD